MVLFARLAPDIANEAAVGKPQRAVSKEDTTRPMDLVSRSARYEDFEKLYQVAYTTFGFDHTPRVNVEREWRAFRSNPCCLSVVAEDLDREADDRFVGYTEGVFISKDFAERARAGAAPYINLQIATSIRNGHSPLLNITDIAIANSSDDGVHFYIAYTAWCEPPLLAQECHVVRVFLSEEFRKIGSGYNYNEVLIEVVGDGPRLRALNAGFNEIQSYQAYYRKVSTPPPHLHPYLLGITRKQAETNDGSLLSHAFAYRKPIFYFTFVDQELLRHTLAGIPDEKIKDILCTSLRNVRKHWTAIYERVETILLDLLPPSISSVRGKEKKQPLLPCESYCVCACC